MDIFETKNIKPMLIKSTREAFNSPDFIFELKLDGERCIAYLDKNGTELRNKRNQKMLIKVPELSNIHKQIKNKCILDGELIIIKDGKPSFKEMQRRSLMSNTFKIGLASTRLPASFTAFDILYLNDHLVTHYDLMKRKELLENTIIESERLAISRYIEEYGIQYYNLAEQNQLEGIVAKRKDSKYYFGKRTNDWIKIKNLMDDDFVVCGYITKESGVTSIILGQYEGSDLLYKGHVTLGISSQDLKIIKSIPRLDTPLFSYLPPSNDNAIWIEPILVCKVEYMMKTSGGFMRQPVYKGLRKDKKATECISE